MKKIMLMAALAACGLANAQVTGATSAIKSAQPAANPVMCVAYISEYVSLDSSLKARLEANDNSNGQTDATRKRTVEHYGSHPDNAFFMELLKINNVPNSVFREAVDSVRAANPAPVTDNKIRALTLRVPEYRKAVEGYCARAGLNRKLTSINNL